MKSEVIEIATEVGKGDLVKPVGDDYTPYYYVHKVFGLTYKNIFNIETLDGKLSLSVIATPLGEEDLSEKVCETEWQSWERSAFEVSRKFEVVEKDWQPPFKD